MTKPKATRKYGKLRGPEETEPTPQPETEAPTDVSVGSKPKADTAQLNVQVPVELRVPFRIRRCRMATP